MHRRNLTGMFLITVLVAFAIGQDAKTPTTRTLSPTARLTAARTAYLKNGGGGGIPFDVISEGVQGWGRYQIVNSPEEADLVIEVASTSSGNGISVSGGSSTDPRTGFPTESATNTRELSVDRIRLVVYDARSKMPLWSASEQPKGAMRDKARKDNVVEAAQRLVTKFRERVEPDAPK